MTGAIRESCDSKGRLKIGSARWTSFCLRIGCIRARLWLSANSGEKETGAILCTAAKTLCGIQPNAQHRSSRLACRVSEGSLSCCGCGKRCGGVHTGIYAMRRESHCGNSRRQESCVSCRRPLGQRAVDNARSRRTLDVVDYHRTLQILERE